jgi:hypothetical protein
MSHQCLGVQLEAKPGDSTPFILESAQVELPGQCHQACLVLDDAVSLARVQQNRHGGWWQVVGFAIGVLGKAHWPWGEEKAPRQGLFHRDHVALQAHPLAVCLRQLLAKLQSARADGPLEEGGEGQIERRDKGFFGVRWYAGKGQAGCDQQHESAGLRGRRELRHADGSPGSGHSRTAIQFAAAV